MSNETHGTPVQPSTGGTREAVVFILTVAAAVACLPLLVVAFGSDQ